MLAKLLDGILNHPRAISSELAEASEVFVFGTVVQLLLWLIRIGFHMRQQMLSFPGPGETRNQ